MSRGGRTQVDNGDGTYTSSISNAGTKATLEFLHDVKWEDNAFGAKVDLDWGTINQEFAAGNLGMFTSGSDVYTALVRDFGMDPDQYGLTVMPLEGEDPGTLGGGDIAVVSPTVDETTKAAAVKWIDWYYMQKAHERGRRQGRCAGARGLRAGRGHPRPSGPVPRSLRRVAAVDRRVRQRAPGPDDPVHREHLGPDPRG
ncbi:extracellular solute-binding protein [Demequina litorisediminis]|uniref:extracellular solute-binding protein n=1 Tax=Demequina litorisediminis TaxID=1849022 RepID=UPI0024E18FF9|nr:hypothetical protein [Demequina litorisediminis]